MKKQNFDTLETVFSSFIKKSIPKFIESNDNNLSSSQYIVLRLIVENGPQKMTDLSNELNVTLSAITGLSDKLINEGFLERKRCDDDRRIVRLFMTKKGEEMYTTITEKRKEKIVQLHQNLDDEEIEFLIKIYLKMLDNIS